ncbi:MAG: Flp pilus assembly complex ATPase component TadA [Acidobacteria bacterium]|nr:Flp pilus assembly complex ATPase component TadA [Acidobacteriota bacterium]MBV9479041.1 Flp pilus assembly complex ATPase component TadA [Acidobacteriota bacterium]
MTAQASSSSSLERELEYRKRLTAIANQINSAESIPHILMTLKDRILELLDAERLTIYAVDTKNQELYSLQKVGDQPKEIRVPKSFASIAGFTALARKTINIKDAYDASELQRFHANLRFDQRWDKQTGFRTKAVLAVPILFEKYLLGVVQLINKRLGVAFTAQDEDAAEEIARILGIAFYNQHRVTRQSKPSRFGTLIDKGALSEKDLEQAVSNARVNNTNVEKVLIEDYNVPREEIGRSLSAYYSAPWFDYTGTQTIPADLRDRVSADIWRKHGAAPIDRKPGMLILAVDDPQDLTRLDGIRAMNLAPRYEFHVAMKHDILAYLAASYGEKTEAEQTGESTEWAKILDSLGEGERVELDDNPTTEPEIDETDSGIVRLANQLIIEAFARGASDIHVEPDGQRHPCTIRLRIDGDCQKFMEIPGAHKNALVQRLKIMAKLDISERRKPQDGKIRFKYSKGTIELRVATIPTTNQNEDVVMRILAASKPLPLDKMGFSDKNLARFKELLAKPYGIALVVGPTGSGKTTTLHSALGFINTEDMKIWTAEDPVEITQKGLRQVQVQPKIDFTFAAAMRSFLRADPDVIMVGEMRDHETAAIGIEASLTGHLVFSTLHTNSAPETITRLLDMNIDPFNFADALLGIMAQRLIRTLCPKCKEGYNPTPEEFEEIIEAYGYDYWKETGITYSPQLTLYRPKGCPNCMNTGYKGRMGVHELLVGTDEMKRAIQHRSPIDELRRLAMEQGMRTLMQDAIEKAFKGVTDVKQARAIAVK